MQGMSSSSSTILFPDHEHLKCPRCDSMNTKFCYYNNYNLSQPRYFCKNCRRYWTKGGALRNIPVGGGTRKNAKRRSIKKTASPDPPPPPPTTTDANASLSPLMTYEVVQFGNLFDGSGSNGATVGNMRNGELEPNFHVGENSSDRDLLGSIESGGDFNGGWSDLSNYTPDFTYR